VSHADSAFHQPQRGPHVRFKRIVAARRAVRNWPCPPVVKPKLVVVVLALVADGEDRDQVIALNLE
jgi:hypothetical protein